MNKRLLHAAQTVLTEPVEAEGTQIELHDTVKAPMKGLHIYGRSTQAGTPSPENPVEIVSVGDVGSVGVDVIGGNLAKFEKKEESEEIPDVFTINGYTVHFENNSGTVQTANTNTFELQKGKKYVIYFRLRNLTGMHSVQLRDKNGSGVFRLDQIQSGYVFTVGEQRVQFLFTSTTYKSKCKYDVDICILPYSENAKESYGLYRQPQSITISTPTGLPGIPVSSGGNYTDADGQQWVCDEVDFERGVYIQRVYNKIINDFSNAYVNSAVGGYTEGRIDTKKTMLHEIKGLCDKFSYISTGNITRFACYNSFLYFTIPGELSGTEWIQAMNEISPHVMMLLKVPIETPLSAAELAAYKSLHSNYPTTIITNSEDTRMKVNCMKIRGGGV